MADVAPGIRDDLAAAISAAESSVETPAPAQAEAAVVETPEIEAEGVEQPTEGRKRGPDGKFLPKEGDSDPVEATPAQAKAKPAAEAPVEPKATTEALPPIAARWSAADKAMLATLPKEAQDFMTRRYSEMEADHTKKTQAIADLKREYEPIDQMFAPFRPQMQQQGWTPATLIRAWANVEQDLMSGKGADVIAKIARDYRVEPQAIAKAIGIAGQAPAGAAPQPGTGTDPTFDPAVEKLLEAKFGALLTPLQQELQRLQGNEQRRVNEDINQKTQVANRTVQGFIDAAEPNGDLKHPHYAEVESHMVVLAQAEKAAGRVPDLERIYDQAVWANPSTREKLRAAETAALEAKTRAESVAKAKAARNASSSVTGAPGSGLPPKGNSSDDKSLRELIAEAAADNEAA